MLMNNYTKILLIEYLSREFTKSIFRISKFALHFVKECQKYTSMVVHYAKEILSAYRDWANKYIIFRKEGHFTFGNDCEVKE